MTQQRTERVQPYQKDTKTDAEYAIFLDVRPFHSYIK